ncbi:hypothetical protein CL615_02855 [archaeon]|jgi:hypothetical protein|nr:hypothetical protein [archaeon]MDP6547794.1 hypothetical protein [Candidatus Woesearchaeota archaeon]|tara:strand:- start:8069 stop:8389 length:321 start_codon:yes stop_codon:yes gene_type:complete
MKIKNMFNIGAVVTIMYSSSVLAQSQGHIDECIKYCVDVAKDHRFAKNEYFKEFFWSDKFKGILSNNAISQINEALKKEGTDYTFEKVAKGVNTIYILKCPSGGKD